jgi:hypothetical protein
VKRPMNRAGSLGISTAVWGYKELGLLRLSPERRPVGHQVQGREHEQREQRRGHQAAIITIASGRSISVPCRRRTSNGSKPRIAVAAVISFGRTLPRLASRTASTRPRPSAHNPRVWVTSTRLFCTAIPNSPIKPTSDETFHVSRASRSLAIPPTNVLKGDRVDSGPR